MSYNYPYGTVPQPGFQAQPGVKTNPYGYASPVAQANPFSALVLAHGMRKAFSGSSSSSDPDVSVVTYDSYMDDKNYSKNTLGLTDTDIKNFGKPLGLKFKDCGVVIPLPSKKAVCTMIENQISDIAQRDITADEKKRVLKMISDNLAVDFFRGQCKTEDDYTPEKCSIRKPDVIDSAIRKVTFRPTGGFTPPSN